jgi:methylated-DNA-protein-cysteine methyltransferase-like protein
MAIKKKFNARKKLARKKSASQSKRVAAKPAVAASDASKIFAAIKRIPKGRVSTYGTIAEVTGLPRRARLVGTVLSHMPSSVKVPWFRVINAGGRISFPVDSDAYERQRSHLEAEGISLVRGRVSLKKYGWPEQEQDLDEMLWRRN